MNTFNTVQLVVLVTSKNVWLFQSVTITMALMASPYHFGFILLPRINHIDPHRNKELEGTTYSVDSLIECEELLFL